MPIKEDSANSSGKGRISGFLSIISYKTICLVLIAGVALGGCRGCSASNDSENEVIEFLRRPNQWLQILAGGGSGGEEGRREIVAKRGAYVVPELIEALKYKDIEVRSEAAIILGMIGPAAKDAAPALIVALKDRDPKVRFSAAAALWRIDQTAHDVTPILVAALKDQDHDIRRLAAKALAERAPEAHSDLAPALIEALKDTSRDVSIPAAIALAQIKPPTKEAISDLVARCCSDLAYTSDADRALVKIGQEAKDEVAPVLIAALTKGERFGLAARLTDILVKIGGAKDAAPALIEALEDRDPRIRVSAAIALAQIKPLAKEAIPVLVAECCDQEVGSALVKVGREAKDDVMPILIAALTTEQDYHRYNSLTKILVEIGPGAKKAAPALIKALKNQDPRIRVSASAALGMIGPAAKDAASALIAALKDQDPKVRLSAAAALWKIDQTAHDVMPVLLEALKDRNSDDCASAVKVLAEAPPKAPEATPDLAPALIEALKDHRNDIHINAATALAQIRPPAKEAIPVLLNAKHIGYLGYSDAGNAFLVKMGQEAKDEVMPALTAALIAGANDQRAWLTDILVKIGPAAKDAAPALIEALKHRSPRVRVSAAAALWRIDQTAHDVTPTLVAALKDQDRDIRHVAAEALAKKAPEANPALVSALVKALKTLRGDVAINAAIALAQIRPPAKEAIPVLLTECSHPGADRALVKMGQEAKDEVMPALIAAMTTEPKDKKYCRYASLTEILVKIGVAKDAEPVLIAALADQDPSICYQAAKALGQLGPEAKAAMPALNKALADKDPDVAAGAASALSRIQGRTRY